MRSLMTHNGLNTSPIFQIYFTPHFIENVLFSSITILDCVVPERNGVQMKEKEEIMHKSNRPESLNYTKEFICQIHR